VLTAVMGNANLASRKLPAEDRVQPHLDEIVKATESAASLTRQLLTFSRQRALQSRILDLNASITSIDRLVRRLTGASIDLVIVKGSCGVVRGDPGQIEQIVLNLAINARDAMPGGGRLTIETADVTLEPGLAAESRAAAGDYVMLAVSDDGAGMSPATLSRMFEPFFTTKMTGTGLGLATVRGIVTESAGHIEVHSELGRGTSIKVYLPRVTDADVPTASAADTTQIEGTETLLLVEDDLGIRRVLSDALRLFGYTVLDAADGAEALALIAGAKQPVDLVISDIVLPFVSGSELAQRLAAAHANLPVLLISGYAERALIHQGRRHPQADFLQKPFSPETLAQKVRSMLDGLDARAA